MVDGKQPSLQGEPAFLKGHVEIQDEAPRSSLPLLAQRRRSGSRSLRRGGRQDARPRRDDEQPGSGFRDRQRCAPPCADPRAAGAGGARNVQVRTPRGKVMPIDDLAGRIDLGADRCALHRHGDLATQSGCQMAASPRLPSRSG